MAFPTTESASDLWSLKDQYIAKAGDNWPSVAASAPALIDYSSGTVTNHGTGLGGAYGICFNNNGTKFYVASYNTTDVIKQYNLSTAYDISTASLNYNYGGQGKGVGSTIAFAPGGNLFFFGDFGTETITAVNLTTAFDLSTVTGVASTLSNGTNGGWWFNNNGTKVYCTDRTYIIYSFTLSTAYDLSSAGSRSAGVDVSSLVSNGPLYGGRFYSDGLVLYVGARSTDYIYRFVLSTPYDETSIVSVTAQIFSYDVYSLEFSPDFSLLVTGAGSGTAGIIASYEI